MGYGRIAFHDIDERHGGEIHEVKGRILRSLHAALNYAGILLRKETGGNLVKHQAVERNGEQKDDQYQSRIIQNPKQRLPVQPDHAIEDLLAGPVKNVVLLTFFMRSEDVRAHAWRRSKGNDHRNNNGRRQRHREFAKEASDDAAHQQDGNENRNERHADGKNRETNLLGAFHCSGKWLHAALNVPCDVLHHNDGIVHYKSGGDGQRHQRKIIERVAEQIHRSERADE